MSPAPDYLTTTFKAACKASIPPTEEDHKALGVDDYVLTLLITTGLSILLPELKQWVKLGMAAIAVKRLEIEKQLKEYAAEKELDMDEAQQAAYAVAQNITPENINQIIAALEKRQGHGNTGKN